MPKLYPTLRFRDVDAAIAWMRDVLGFTEHVVYRDDTGAVVHGEMAHGDDIVMFGTRGREGTSDEAFPAGGSTIYVGVDDIEAVHERAVAAGADVVVALHDTDYGSRDFTVRDPEGNRWSVGTYTPRPDQPPL
jgi:uncharacterized glyoxalase superfamily protein PhnB